MDLVILGDSHELHREVEVPAADLFICCGDFTLFSKSLSAIEDFNEWLGELPHAWKLVIPGNHEFFLESDAHRRSLISNATVLIDEEITIDGLKIYGSPMTPLYGGAFGKSSPADRVRHWGRIPSDVNVLISHGPPYGILDRSPGQLEHMGDPELMARVKELPSLRLHCFGHVHGSYGMMEEDGVVFVNAALMGSLGDIDQAPVVLRMKPDEVTPGGPPEKSPSEVRIGRRHIVVDRLTQPRRRRSARASTANGLVRFRFGDCGDMGGLGSLSLARHFLKQRALKL